MCSEPRPGSRGRRRQVTAVTRSSGHLNRGVRVPSLAWGNNGCVAGVTTELARVLIVDDKADIRTLLATRLRLEPAFSVVGEAANGAEAIARVGELRPHLMVLDLQMPIMSGEEVIPIVRSLAPRLRIVVFSAYAGSWGRLGGTERPDAEVRKGSGLQPLVTELHRLLVEPPRDLIEVYVGSLDATPACTSWRRIRAGWASSWPWSGSSWRWGRCSGTLPPRASARAVPGSRRAETPPARRNARSSL